VKVDADVVVRRIFQAANILLSFPVALLRALVASTLWNWFAISYFRLPHLSMWRAYCLMVIWSIFENLQELPVPDDEEGKKKRLIESLARRVALSFVLGFILLVAWLIHLGGVR
jgi:hypothetical protein